MFYTQSFSKIIQAWDDIIRRSIEKRINTAFDSLLPIETIESVKKMCILISIHKTYQKTDEWRRTHVKSIGINTFNKDFPLGT